MKPLIPTTLLGALFAFGVANAATTTPVGYYAYDGIGGGNICIPSFVNPAAFSGALTAASGATLTVAANSLTANAYNQGAVYKKFYAEITSGPNAGVVLDIVSNTTNVVTLGFNISGLGLTGTETITIRPHVTLKSFLSSAEASLNAFSDSATFYANGTFQTYYYGGDGGTGWSSDFATADGSDRPVPPGTGFVLGLAANVRLTITGEVKAPDTFVQLVGGVVNIVGPVNPLVGDSVNLSNTGFERLAAFSDSVTIYQPGPLSVFKTYYPIYGPFPGDPGVLSDDFSTPTSDTMKYTTGAVVIPSSPTALKLDSGL
ncbi:hypothetical protein [Luteolibacter soli]|uniref:Uncharacterized protein n=1 Tax=Luteolibacter soli TaxID=3135280 RepID=A0ABU9B3W1_9BACT